MNSEVRGKPNMKEFEGVESSNPKFKEGTMKDAYDKANSTEEGKKALPTVPE